MVEAADEASGEGDEADRASSSLRGLPRNLWAASGASFLTDVSSEMILNLVPLFLANVLGVKTAVIGLIEGVAETTASLLKLVAGRASDRVGRKGLAVSGYTVSTLSKPVFAWATSWGVVAGARWADRMGKGVRTAPRDALIADSIAPHQRGLAFGFHRAADTGGAVVGLLIAMGVVWALQGGRVELGHDAFRALVWASVVPAVLGVLCLALGARDVRVARPPPGAEPRSRARLGRPFLVFLAIVGLFELGNSADAFLVLRAQESGLSVLGILGVLLVFNAVYALVSTPAGRLSDRVGRRPVLIAAWLLYAAVYVGFAWTGSAWQTAGLYALYGAYYGLAAGTGKALVADLVPAERRGAAFGAFNATLGLMDLPASLLAGVLWQGVGAWSGYGPAAPFLLGGSLAALAAAALALWHPPDAGPTAGDGTGAPGASSESAARPDPTGAS
ncbi:MAG: MFS transporter [Myxococcota bacterium]